MRLHISPRTRGMSAAEGAAHWTVLKDGRDLTPAEQRELDAWLADPVNAQALHRAEAALHLFDGAASNDPNLRALRQAALEAAPVRQFPVRTVGGGLAAASIAGLLWVAGIHHGGENSDHRAPETQVASSVSPAVKSRVALGPSDYTTGVGERRSVRLADGTMITLNTRSRVVVAYTEQRRLVRLVRGQALFEVAHNPNRPFVVEAADRQVTALGTVFEVRLDPGLVNVVLVKGRVVVDRIPNASAQYTSVAKPTFLVPGQQFSAELGAPQKVTKIDVGQQLLWRDGFVEFDDMPLGAAVAEINRYTNKPIILSNDGVSVLHISGVYNTGQPDRFVDAVQGILPVTAKATPEGEITLSLASKSAQ